MDDVPSSLKAERGEKGWTDDSMTAIPSFFFECVVINKNLSLRAQRKGEKTPEEKSFH